jgi:amidase
VVLGWAFFAKSSHEFSKLHYYWFDHMSITGLSAYALSEAIHARKISCREVMQATLHRIKEVNPIHNAIVSLSDEADLLSQADLHDALLTRNLSKGWLHGIPQAVKDLSNVAGFPTTEGSRLLSHFIPPESGLMAQRMQNAGAIVIGKTNTPEFGLGSHTFNDVFGATANAFDTTKTAGGSSGGAAVALALNMLSVADGSDFMGSLRNPAGWNNVYGMRPSQGRVPKWPSGECFLSQLGTEGPMARTVRDLALLLQTQSGFDDRVPLSIKEAFVWDDTTGSEIAKGARVGWLRNLDGYLAMDPGILEISETGLRRLESAGAKVETISLGYPPETIWDAWLVWRAALVAGRLGVFAADHKNHERMKPEALWEYESAQRLSASDFSQASVRRTHFYHHLLSLFERFDFLVLPTAQVWPFGIGERWPSEIGGRSMDTYHRWMEVVIYATFAGLPAVSVPLGFGTSGMGKGLPVGLQIMGRPQGDKALLKFAAAYEALM